MPVVSVLIVNFNAGQHLSRCLQHLSEQSETDFEAIVVDNASSDDSLSAARLTVQTDPRFRFVEAGRNLGFATANNMAAAMATSDWLALLNPDAFPEQDWLAELMAATRRHPKVPAFGSLQLATGKQNLLDGAGDRYFAAGIAWRGGHGWPANSAGMSDREVFSPCAAAALYRKDAFQALGGFDEHFFCYYEDVDFGFRLRLKGYLSIQVMRARVNHVGGASGGNTHFATYHGCRNMLWCFVKNMPPLLFWPLAPFHVLLLLLLLSRKSLQGQFHPVLHGLLDGVRALPSIWALRQIVQRQRSVTYGRLMHSLSWNPHHLATRRPI